MANRYIQYGKDNQSDSEKISFYSADSDYQIKNIDVYHAYGISYTVIYKVWITAGNNAPVLIISLTVPPYSHGFTARAPNAADSSIDMKGRDYGVDNAAKKGINGADTIYVTQENDIPSSKNDSPNVSVKIKFAKWDI